VSLIRTLALAFFAGRALADQVTISALLFEGMGCQGNWLEEIITYNLVGAIKLPRRVSYSKARSILVEPIQPRSMGVSMGSLTLARPTWLFRPIVIFALTSLLASIWTRFLSLATKDSSTYLV
jgi:hypothetical protein